MEIILKFILKDVTFIVKFIKLSFIYLKSLMFTYLNKKLLIIQKSNKEI